VGEAYETIIGGSADAILTGATGTRLHPMNLIHAVQQEELANGEGEPTRASRPFDRDRTGMVPGEGAGAIMLEELAIAEARGATIYGEIVAGSSSSTIGRRLVARREKAMTNALQAVLEAAGYAADEVGHLHAHGLSTRTCDAEEARAINNVFGNRKDPIPVVAAKSSFGNLGAGSGMVELIASLMALKEERLFPVLNYENPDPQCPINVVTDAQATAGESFVTLNVTPQGQATAVMIRGYG